MINKKSLWRDLCFSARVGVFNRIVTILVVTLLSGVILAGCTKSGDSGTASSEKITIAYSCPDMNNTFMVYLVDAAKEFAAKNDINLIVADSQMDVVKQQDQIRAFIQQKVNGIVMVAADSSATEPITDMAVKANIPLAYCNIFPFDEDNPNMPQGIYYVGSKEIDAGIIQGEMLGKALGGQGGIGILMGGLTNEASYKRSGGVKQVIGEKYPNIKVLAEETAQWQRDKAVDVVNNWLTAYGAQLKGIGANNDEMALGAVEALKAAGRTDVVVFGTDAIPDATASIVAGELKGTVYQDAVGQAQGAMDIIYKTIRGESISDQILWIPFVGVNPDNVKEFM
jgi:ABC-type sugar transport system substrate-binding protein